MIAAAIVVGDIVSGDGLGNGHDCVASDVRNSGWISRVGHREGRLGINLMVMLEEGGCREMLKGSVVATASE